MPLTTITGYTPMYGSGKSTNDGMFVPMKTLRNEYRYRLEMLK